MSLDLEHDSLDRTSEPGAPKLTAERRHGPRRKLEVEIGLHSDSHFYVGFAEDLSDGGLFVATYEAVPLSSPVRVVFELPCGTRVSAPGRVAWVREPLEGHAPGVGVAFEALSDEQREAILAFVRERPPLFYDVGG